MKQADLWSIILLGSGGIDPNTMYVTNLRSGLEYIVKEQNDLAKDYYKKIAQPVRV